MEINGVKVKKKIQELLYNNTASAIGDFHFDELDEFNFINDLTKHCKMVPVEGCKNTNELLGKIIKSATNRVGGMINSRELKQSKFFKELFNSFKIEVI